MRSPKNPRHAGPRPTFCALLLGLGAIFACSPRRAERHEGAKPQKPPRTDIVLTGAEAMGDFTTDAPGVKRKITVADLPPPNENESVSNRPKKVDRPKGALPRVPAGFAVNEFAGGFDRPRVVRAAPNGDIFVVESAAGRVQVLRDADHDGKAESRHLYVEGLKKPFGLSFYPADADAPTHLYIANTDSVVRYPYKPGDVAAGGPAERVVSDLPSGGEEVGGGGHWTRDIAFSKDNLRMFVSVGSRSNVSDDASERRRACVLSFTPDGKNEALYASGIRNPVGIAVDPSTGALWASVNERDELGDDLVPDYVTRVQEGGFYGWPWLYLGKHQDPRHEGKHPELKDKTIVPDVLIQAHSASLALCFYTGRQFPPGYRGHIFAAQHGSWNRSRRTGYKVIRVPVANGRADGHYEDFLTGFVTPDGDVWGRPVGVAVAGDGALLVTDDQGGTVWRVSYGG